MSSPYGNLNSSKGAGSGSAYANLSPGGGSSKKSAGGVLGLLGHVGHVIAQKSDLAARDIKGIPGGVIEQANTAIVQPWKDFVTTGHVSKKTNAGIDKLTQQTFDSAQQTIEHPGRDPFATLLLAAPVLHGAGRAGIGAAEAGRVAKAGGSVGEIAKAAATKPEQIPRALVSGDKATPLIASRGGFGRVVQAGYDKAVQGALDKNEAGLATGPVSKRLAAHGQKRIGGALTEEAGIQQKMRAVPASMLDKSAGKLAKTRSARREQQAALELTSAQTTPEEAAAYHRAQAEKGVNPNQNRAVASLYDRVAKRDLLHVDETRPAGEKVFVNPAHPKLAKVDAALARVQSRGDRILVEKGIREAPALQERVNSPGRVRAGATYEKPTASKAGHSPALEAAVATRDRIAQAHEHALTQEAKWHAAEKARDLGPLTEADARARLAQLDAQHDALAAKIVPEISQYGGDISRREQLSRNYENSLPRATRKPTVKDEELAAASDKLHEIAAKGGNPTADALASLLNERARLRDALTARDEAAMAGEPAPGLPRGTTAAHVSVPPASNPFRNRIVQLSTALEQANAKVDRLGAQAAARVKPTGIVGGEEARPGRGFVSGRISEKKLSKAEASASRGPVVGVAKSPIDAKPYTGRSLELGLVPKHVTAAASQHFRQILKFVNTDAHRRAALETGSTVRRSNRDVLVREPDVTAEKLSAQIQQALGREHSTVDTAEELATQEGLQAAHQAFLEHLLPDLKSRFANDRGQAIGVKAPEGYRWVDKGALGDLAHAPMGPRGRIARTTDTVNSAVTAMTVYFKVGHVGTRVLTNAATNIIQGSLQPLQAKKSFQLWDKLDEEQRGRALAASGQHGFSSLPHEGENIVSRVAGKGANWWAKHADAMFRFNSLAYELRKVGYKTPEQVTKALDHLESGGQGLPAHEWSKLSAAARRADREAISYGRLNDFERRFLTRAVWFYPWIKGSTLFTVRTAIEHPFKAAYLGATGSEGRQAQERELGPTPSYEAGLVKLFGSSDHPGVADFSTFSPFATASDVIQAPVRPGALAGFLNPVMGAGNQFVNGLNQFGGASKQPYIDSLLALAAATPEQQLADAYASQGKDQSKRIFHKSLLGTLERYGVGPALPRRANRSALASSAARETSGRR